LAYKIILLEEAEREYNQAAVWYEEQSPGLGIGDFPSKQKSRKKI